MDGALNELSILKASIAESLLRLHTKSEEVIGNIRLEEPPESATRDIEKIKRAIDSVNFEFESFQTEIWNNLDKHRRLCVFKEGIDKIDSDLYDLNEQLKNMEGKLGDNLSASKAALAAFDQFEQTIMVR